VPRTLAPPEYNSSSSLWVKGDKPRSRSVFSVVAHPEKVSRVKAMLNQILSIIHPLLSQQNSTTILRLYEEIQLRSRLKLFYQSRQMW
jgi:hypothetical protein